MRRISDIRNLPISELTDEEICKAAMHRLNTRMCVLMYRGEDGRFNYIVRFRDRAGRSVWNKIKMNFHSLCSRVHTRFAEKYGFEHSDLYKP